MPLLFSCGDNKKDNETENTAKQEEKDTDNLDRKITTEMINAGYTGKGTYTSANGNKYVGEYKDGKIHGEGTYTFANGTVKEGLWKNGKFIGEQ